MRFRCGTAAPDLFPYRESAQPSANSGEFPVVHLAKRQIRHTDLLVRPPSEHKPSWPARVATKLILDNDLGGVEAFSHPSLIGQKDVLQ